MVLGLGFLPYSNPEQKRLKLMFLHGASFQHITGMSGACLAVRFGRL